ncbi:MAG TPA: EsaB/YukD family protein [Chthonomonadales bacterium]|nr:EsaB/YukD family protein [Chthonomonadales bacterium]
MRTLEVLIEQNALGAVRPMEVAAQAPISDLLPAIVEELQLPRTDLFGNRLVYLLRHANNGPVLPGDRSLEAAGIDRGAQLALDSYVVDGSVAAVIRGQGTGQLYQPGFYASETMADAEALSALDLHTSAALPAVRRPKKRRWTRRAFLVMGSMALGASTVGLSYAGYAAYRQYVANRQSPTSLGMMQTTATQKKPVSTPVPTRAQAALVFSQHTQPVRSVVWSPDGKLLASGANDAQLFIWDTMGAVQRQQQQSGQVRAVAWSPDGTLLATAATNRLTWLNAQTGAQQAQSRHTHTGTITTLDWSPQAPYRLVSGATDNTAVVWDSTAFQAQTVFQGHTAPVESASWAADNQTVGTSSHGGVVRVWMASGGQELHAPFIDAQQPMRALAFNRATNLLAVGGDDGIVRLWNGLTCQQAGQGQFGAQCLDTPTRIAAQHGVLRALAWSPDGRFLASGGDDGSLALWNPAQSQVPLLTAHHNNPVLALAWSPDGKHIAAASGNTVTLWTLQ